MTPFYNSPSPYNEGRKDGYRKAPLNRGHYGEAEWQRYLAGYVEGLCRSMEFPAFFRRTLGPQINERSPR